MISVDLTEEKTELRSWLKAIGEVTAAVNAARDLKTLLDLIADTAHELLDLSYCAVMLPDDANEYLSVAGASGLPDQYIARVNRERPVRLEPGPLTGAPASRAFRSGKPCAVSDIAEESSSDWTTLTLEQGYRSLLCVPLLTNTGSVGTLNSYRVTPHDFQPAEIEQLELLAEHATIALTSARVLEDLRRKHQLIVRSEEIHDRFLGIALRSGGVSGIASALHDLLGCDVLIRDIQGSILAAEPGRSADRVGDEFLVNSAERHARRELVREVNDHVAADVVLSGSTVATVWLLGQAGKLDPLGIRATEHACVVLSLELLRQRTAAEVEQALRGELLADLLAGADDKSPAIQARAKLMGHNLSVPHLMMVAASKRTATPARIPRESEVSPRAITEVARLTSHLVPRPLVASVRGVVVALWPDAHGEEAGERALRRGIAAAQEGSLATIVVSRIDNTGIPAAYRSARGALAFAARDGETSTYVKLDDLGAAGLLLQFAEPEELRRYADRTIGELRRYDTDHNAELIKTLRAYLDCDLDRRATAEVLVLHPNTVSQRLRRIEVLSDLSLRSPRAIIEVRTALMLTDVADAVTGVRD